MLNNAFYMKYIGTIIHLILNSEKQDIKNLFLYLYLYVDINVDHC